ncbi:TonB C-terminal domain-containing protein [Vibrio sp. D431a]|uniref:TonB C-terminal domain-containing protein n=1 Tax=Vibrio sp. D431a TaxID=2837388 RepID=UPI002556D346|nr:TonB C-terminal domain-containing protein [Vibrio sp. D431a]MDK9790604.1 TonB C-terminal domain-containing protein [Vibrio sp. D431a]
MKRKITFRQALTVAFGGHIALLVGLTLASLFESGNSPQTSTNLIAQEDYIETYRVESQMVSEQKIAEQVDAYKKLLADNASKEKLAERNVRQLQAKEAEFKRRVKEAKSQLSTVESRYKETSKELEKVRKQKDKEAKDLAKKLEAEQQKARDEQKEIVADQREAQDKAARLEAMRRDNTKLLQEVQENNRELERAQLAKARGVYERTIHDNLIKNWTLPFMRKSVNCKVELSVTPTGVIQSFKIHKPCDDLYKKSIVTAIEKTAFLPRVNETVFKNTEIVNFIDNSNGVYIK